MEFLPRPIRPVPPRLGFYLRPSRIDHRAIVEFLSEGTPDALEGVVFDPCLDSRQTELRREVLERRVEAVVDPRAMELATVGGFHGVATLPWAGLEPHRPESLRGTGGRALVDKLTAWVVERGFSAVLAPTHLILKGFSDPWFETDKELTFAFRDALDRAGLANVPIYYPLAVHGEAFYNAGEREAFRLALSTLPVDAVWLRIQPFGSRSGARVLGKFIAACRDLHVSQRPLVAERTGTVGLALLAFGAVGGIESGLTIGEHFDAMGLFRQRVPGKGFGPHSRVYIRDLQTFLTLKKARAFFENRGMRAHFACRDSRCCRHGCEDMVNNPRRHFLRSRLAEIGRLSQLPEVLRPVRYMEEVLRPATDRLIRATKVLPELEHNRRRMDAWRYTLGSLLESGAPLSFSSVPEGRRIRALRGA